MKNTYFYFLLITLFIFSSIGIISSIFVNGIGGLLLLQIGIASGLSMILLIPFIENSSTHNTLARK